MFAYRCLPIVATCVFLPLIGVLAADVHLRPDGNDALTGGDRVAAVRSLARGLALVRASPLPRRLVLHTGTWEDVSLRLGPDDSGLEITAAGGETPRLLGGRILRKWRDDGDGCMATPVPGTKDRSWDFRALVVDGRLAPRARLPEKGWFEHESRFTVGWASTTAGGFQGKDTPETKRGLRYRAGDVGSWFNVVNAEATIMHQWDESQVGFSAHDLPSRFLTFSNQPTYPPGAFGVQRWCIWNVRQGLTGPGQWYLDRERELVVYRPRPGESMDSMEVIAPTQETLITIQGDTNRPCTGIRLSGLRITAASLPLRGGGFGGDLYPAAIHLQHTERCSLTGLHISAVAGHGIRISNGNGTEVSRCALRNIGTSGIYHCGGKGNVIADNRVEGVGDSCISGVGIRSGNGDDDKFDGNNVVEHNIVSGGAYCGIVFSGTKTRVSGNIVEKVMQTASDGAGIYGGGRNNLITSNRVQGLMNSHPSMVSGIYIDERGKDTVVEGNRILDCSTPFHMHFSGPNTLRGNVCTSKGDMTLSFARCTGYVVERNIFRADKQIRVLNPNQVAIWKDNLAWSEANTYKDLPESVRREDPRFLSGNATNAWTLDPKGLAATLGLGIDTERCQAGPRIPSDPKETK